MVVVLGPVVRRRPTAWPRSSGSSPSTPRSGAILIAAELTTDLFRQALRAGVKDVLAAPVDTDGSWSSRCAGSASGLRRRRRGRRRRPTADDGELGQVITVFSTKGGAGKSVIATNLAVVLAQRSERPVVLVDADLQFGDIAVMLKLAPQHTIVDAVGALDRLDAAVLQNLLIRHEPSGLYVLPAPLEPAVRRPDLGAPRWCASSSSCAPSASYVVIDTPAYFNDVVLGLIEMSATTCCWSPAWTSRTSRT